MSYTNAFDLESATSTWINRQHNNIETKEGSPEDNVYNSYLPIPISNANTDTVPPRKSQAPLSCRPSSSGLVLGSTSSHVPGEHCSNMLYHNMATSPMNMMPSQQLNHPYVEPAKKFMTPLHVITSMSNDHLPFYSYPQGDSYNMGGGLLKIASEVKSTGVVPPASSSKVDLQSHGHVSEYRYQCSNTRETASFSGVIRPTWRSVCQPTMAVAPIGLIDDRMITKRPAPPESILPQLKKRRLRTSFSKEQVNSMERYFKMSMYLNVIDRKELARQLGLEETQVKTWFQNRRMRWKRQRPEEMITTAAKTVRTMKTLQCPPVATQGQFLVSTPPLSNVSTPPAASVMGMPRQFVVPTPKPSNLTTPPAVAGLGTGSGQSEGLPWYPMLAPSTIYSQTSTSIVPTESCCPAQPVYGTPIFPHFPAGLGIYPWTSTNTIGPHGGVQYPPRHV